MKEMPLLKMEITFWRREREDGNPVTRARVER
jgi:hypothetical protein